ncbi:SRPBCC family protein [Mycobacterium sp. CVI_P3]|uniref:SRPBCC family protein n=1 Tax=Mycobacterium pinniadriaticum TaxID=2994102 RepID=A0ABT3SCR1_9MYCO|nr:SRPBCC family protein [Mycobacterium pinniadriaticum]MCX2930884.1 SRPBCC family protein [Mycobacterium pinniadriaticum]MCX2937308.1 SRPBCC family protein [Mycobacterium pinniadriaticum]
MVRIHVEKTILAPPNDVFTWLADPTNLEAAPLILRAGWAEDSPAPSGLGAVRTGLAIGLWFREEITAYDPPHSYTYLIVKSVPAFDHEGGTLTFTPDGDGTHVDWVSAYTHPIRGGGKAMEALTGRLLPWSFRAILNACAKELEP